MNAVVWLFNEENIDEDHYFELLTAMRNDLKTGRASAIKENFVTSGRLFMLGERKGSSSVGTVGRYEVG